MQNVEQITAYQLSKNLKADYRAIRKLLEDYRQAGLVEVVGHSDNSSNAPIYGIDELVKSKMASALQARKGKIVSDCNSDLTRELKQLKDLQLQAAESANTIKSLNELITAKDKELQQLTNSNVILDADLKIAKSELKLITDKSKTVEADNARLKQELTAKEKVISRQNRLLIGAGAVLLVVVVVITCYFLFSR